MLGVLGRVRQLGVDADTYELLGTDKELSGRRMRGEGLEEVLCANLRAWRHAQSYERARVCVCARASVCG
eukprot:1158373-Pelagomonas_calceolata.AAC.4